MMTAPTDDTDFGESTTAIGISVCMGEITTDDYDREKNMS